MNSNILSSIASFAWGYNLPIKNKFLFKFAHRKTTSFWHCFFPCFLHIVYQCTTERELHLFLSWLTNFYWFHRWTSDQLFASLGIVELIQFSFAQKHSSFSIAEEGMTTIVLLIFAKLTLLFCFSYLSRPYFIDIERSRRLSFELDVFVRLCPHSPSNCVLKLIIRES